MPLYKVTGRFWVALDLDDFISNQPQNSQESAEKSTNNSNDSSNTYSIRESEKRGIRSDDKWNDKSLDPPWGVVDIVNKAMEARRTSSENHQSISASTGKILQEFSVPVGVSSKRKKLEDGSHIAVGAEVRGTEEGQIEAEKQKMKGEFVMPTGLGVSTKRGTGLGANLVKRDRDGNSLASEREVEEEREKEKDKGSGSFERRMLYEASVRHTTLGLDMSLSHIHKFVGRRFDHEVYTQVLMDLCVSIVSSRWVICPCYES